jgi:hypothetical protein
MKKKLEADLISIAHRILQLKNKSDINQLYLETQQLYEKLAILRFVEEHFGEAKPTIGQAEVVEKVEEFFENTTVPELQRPDSVINTTVEETPIAEEITEAETVNSVEIEDTQEEEIKNEENKIETEEITATTEELPTSITPEPLAEVEESEDITVERTEEAPIEAPMFALEKTEIESIAEQI